MNALLQEKETCLQALTSCPVCRSRRLEYWRHEKFGPQVDEEDDFLWRLPKVDDQATARFWCGMILWLDEKAKINIRYGCTLATMAAVQELNRKPETVLEEKAA